MIQNTYKRILITGANRGIGLELTKKLREYCTNIDVLVRNSSEELETLGLNVFSGFELSNFESIDKACLTLKSNSYDLIILNAGVLSQESLASFNRDTYEAIEYQFKVNALAPLMLTARLKNQLMPGSKLVLITSRMGSIADNSSGSRYGYRMSKSALNAAAKSMAVDLAESQVSVGVFHPGYVQTGMTGFTGNIQPVEAAEQLVIRINNLSLETSGMFFHANGEPLAW